MRGEPHQEDTMKKRSALSFVTLIPAAALAAQAAQHLPRGTATDITNAEIEATVKKTASLPVSDQQLRIIGINGEYNVGVGVVHRARTANRDIGGGSERSQMTESDHVISC